MKHVLFAVTSLLLLSGLIGLLLAYGLRIRRASRVNWSDLMNRLVPINRDGIRRVALDLTSYEPGNLECSLGTSDIWELLGGLAGVESMAANCEVMIELAIFVQKWHPEAVEVAEELRINAREIKWHVDRLRNAARNGNLQSSYSMYARKAAAVYWQMTAHLVQLYAIAGQFDMQTRLESSV